MALQQFEAHCNPAANPPRKSLRRRCRLLFSRQDNLKIWIKQPPLPYERQALERQLQ